MTRLRLLDLFSGIGGFSLGLERSGGFNTVAFCEINPFCHRVLSKHWPKVPRYHDIQELTVERLTSDGIAVDAICGGFPCQDLSLAGKGAGLAGERSGLWREYSRLIGELRPKFVVVENVAALLGRGLGDVLGDLASLGYDAEWECIPASSVGAPHRRDRLWIIAYPGGSRAVRLVEGISPGASGPWGVCREADMFARSPFSRGDCWPQPLIRRMDDGFSRRVDRLRAVGNAVVPQIPELIGRAIVKSIQEQERAP